MLNYLWLCSLERKILTSGYFRAMQFVGFTKCSGTYKRFGWGEWVNLFGELMGLDWLVLFRCSTAWVNFVGDDNWCWLTGSSYSIWCLCTWVGITSLTSHTTFLARGLGCTSCTLVACQLWCWLPQYTAAWIWRKSILSANAVVNALTTSRQWTPLSWHFWDMYHLRVGRDPVAQTQWLALKTHPMSLQHHPNWTWKG